MLPAYCSDPCCRKPAAARRAILVLRWPKLQASSWAIHAWTRSAISVGRPPQQGVCHARPTPNLSAWRSPKIGPARFGTTLAQVAPYLAGSHADSPNRLARPLAHHLQAAVAHRSGRHRLASSERRTRVSRNGSRIARSWMAAPFAHMARRNRRVTQESLTSVPSHHLARLAEIRRIGR